MHFSQPKSQLYQVVRFFKGFVKMQGSYNELVQSNKDFIQMMDSLSHEAQKKEENARKTSQMSTTLNGSSTNNKRLSVMRRPSGLSVTSSIAVRQLLLKFDIFSPLKFVKFLFVNIVHWLIRQSICIENLIASCAYSYIEP